MISLKQYAKIGLASLVLGLSMYCGGSSGGSSGGNGGTKPTLEVSISKNSYLRGEQVCVDGTVSGTKDFGWDPNPTVGFNGLTGTLKGCFPLSYGSPLTRQDLVAYAGSLEKSVGFMPLNNPPVADAVICDFSIPPMCSKAFAIGNGDAVTLNGTNSYDVDGTYTCEWDFEGDGVYDISSDCKPNVAYGTGCYHPKLKITDNNTDYSIDEVMIDCGGVCPP